MAIIEFTAGQEAGFNEAVNSFDDDEICVTDEKLNEFLKATQDLGIPPGERLRQLAIALESEGFKNGWQDLRRIYQMASRLNPKDADIFHSWGISATLWFERWQTPAWEDRLAIASEGEKALRQALELEQSSEILYALGMLFYDHPVKEGELATYLNKAADWFRQALKCDSGYVMAQLYLAHCYHDLAQNLDATYWPAALDAYEKVDRQSLVREAPEWYAVKCREQIAVCHAWCGNETEAVRLFSAFLDEVEAFSVDENDMHEAVVNFDEMVNALTQKLPNPELLSRLRKQVTRFNFASWYPELFPAQA